MKPIFAFLVAIALALASPSHADASPMENTMSQVQEYRLDDGTYVRGREHAKYISARDLLSLSLRLVGPVITPAYAVLTCVHEAGDRDKPMLGAAWNQRDTEPDGKHYYGAAMISEEEANRKGFTGVDMHDPSRALIVLASLATDHLGPIIHAGGRAAHERGLPFIVEHIPAYLAYAHNAGLGTERAPLPGHPQGALESIFVHGVDWSRFETGNPGLPIVAHRYGRDCIDGGKLWPLLFPPV